MCWQHQNKLCLSEEISVEWEPWQCMYLERTCMRVRWNCGFLFFFGNRKCISKTRHQCLRASEYMYTSRSILSQFSTIQVVARGMVARGVPGSIVNVSSIASVRVIPNHTCYCSAKAALDMLTMTLAYELGPKQVGCQCTFNGYMLAKCEIVDWRFPWAKILIYTFSNTCKLKMEKTFLLIFLPSFQNVSC